MNKTVYLFFLTFLVVGLNQMNGQSTLISATGGPNPNGGAESVFSDANCSIAGDLQYEADPNQVNGVFSDSNCPLCGTGTQLIAAPYTPTEDVIINEACWVGGYFVGCTPATFPDYTITFFADAAGLPGATIAGPFTVTADNVVTGTVLFGSEEVASSASFDDVSLTAGTQVWFSVQTSSGAGCNYFWETSSDGIDGAFSSDQGGTWNTTGGNAYSFFLGSDVEVEIVPTLGEWAIICLFMVMMIVGTVAVGQRQTAIA